MADDTEQEPSIEEILTSIRQIISDDDEEGEDSADEAPVEEAPEPEEEVIELTEKADPEPVQEEPEPEPIPEPEPEPEPIPEPEPEEVMEIDMQDRVEEPQPLASEADNLLTQRAEAAALDGFKELAAKTAIDSISGVTIEHIVREEIRPMLRVWLDSNLPSIVERLVQEELDRVAKRAMNE